MGNLTLALTFVMIVNVFLFLSQTAILEINPGGNSTYYSYEGTLLEQYDINKNPSDPGLDVTDVTGILPEGEDSVEVSSGNLFTDSFRTIKGWFSTIGKGLNYVKGVVSAPYTALNSMNLPGAFVFGIGSLWYAITLFLVVAFFWGKE